MCHSLIAVVNTIMVLLNKTEEFQMEKFVVTPKEDKSVTMTIRIDRDLQEKYNSLAAKTNRSRNELISMALQYALDHMEIKE